MKPGAHMNLEDLSVVQAICLHAELPAPVLTANGEHQQVALDGRQIAALIDAGSAATGTSGETGVWADDACRAVCERVKASGVNETDAWWQACCLIAEAATRVDLFATAALHDELFYIGN